MGLDIYFHKTTRQEWREYQNECDKFANLSDEEKEKGFHGTEAPGNKFEPEEIGYFRKVNFLMQFFAYYGNCEYKEISRDELEELQDKCLIISEMKPCRTEFHKSEGVWEMDRVSNIYSEADKKRCAEILPTTSGFFFGSTDYDEWYFEDVKEVLNWVTGVLKNLEDDEVVLMYCWW